MSWAACWVQNFFVRKVKGTSQPSPRKAVHDLDRAVEKSADGMAADCHMWWILKYLHLVSW